MVMANTSPGAQVRWNLNVSLPPASLDPAALLERCRQFQHQFHGKVASLEPAGIAELLNMLGDIRVALMHLEALSRLNRAAGQHPSSTPESHISPELLVAEADELSGFFELEWARISDERAAALLTSPELAQNRHFLLASRRFAPYLLSEDAEAALSARQVAATEAWVGLYAHVRAQLVGTVGSHRLGTEDLLAALRDRRRDLRGAALDALLTSLAGAAPILALAYDALITDRLALVALRGYPSVRFERDLD